MRVSTEQQTEKFGLDVQRDEIEKYASENDIEIMQWFEDDGITGKIVDRPALQNMFLSLEENTDVKYVICLCCNRLWRSDIAGGLVRYTLSKFKVDIISVQEPRYSLYTDDPSEYLINSIMSALASYDRMTINLKLSSARKLKAAKGAKACGSAPYGYKWYDANIVIDYNNHLVVQDIYRIFADNHSLTATAATAKAKGYKTSNGNDFSKQSIGNMVHNDFYIGIVTHDGKKYHGTHDPIIDNALFMSCNPDYVKIL